jgi:hypothetical protein
VKAGEKSSRTLARRNACPSQEQACACLARASIFKERKIRFADFMGSRKGSQGLPGQKTRNLREFHFREGRFSAFSQNWAISTERYRNRQRNLSVVGFGDASMKLCCFAGILPL